MNNSNKKILDVGCGTNKVEGAIGLDYNPLTGADVIHDLGVIPYPFEDNEFDKVVSRHVVEHVPDVMAFVTELYRITKNGGRIEGTPRYPDRVAALIERLLPSGLPLSDGLLLKDGVLDFLSRNP